MGYTRTDAVADFVEDVEDHLDGGTTIGGHELHGLSPEALEPLWREVLTQTAENGVISMAIAERWRCPTVEELVRAGLSEEAAKKHPPTQAKPVQARRPRP